jgi:epoxyqueuosine reductase
LPALPRSPAVDRAALTHSIKQKALELGFTKAGVTDAARFDLEADRFEEWVREGNHGYMQWLERNHEKRRDVTEILPGAKSILSLALNYYHPYQHKSDDLKISRYAWGTDYHELVPDKLAELLAYIKELVPEANGRYYTDTGPLLEKAIAQRAGLGWIGKHTNLITREVGSWVFLAEIIVDFELTPDEPMTDMCGTCTRCIDACPTNAISEPFKVDATKCISYLTIELKHDKEIAPEFDLAGWIYGCDICQDVCPWNRFEQPTDIAEFAPRMENVTLSAETLASMEQEEFSRRFKKSPIKRTKLAGLKRNLSATRRTE